MQNVSAQLAKVPAKFLQGSFRLLMTVLHVDCNKLQNLLHILNCFK